MKKERQRLIIALPADTHCGSSVGLVPEEFTNIHGNLVKSNEAQDIVREQWYSSWGKLGELRREKPSRMVIAHIGDTTEGTAIKDKELSAMIRQEQIGIHIGMMNRAFDLVDFRKDPKTEDAIYYLQGSQFHVGYSHESDEACAMKLAAVPRIPPKQDVDAGSWSWPYLVRETAAGKVDLSHHGGHPGVRAWLSGNAFGWAIRSLYFECLDSDVIPPRWIVRAHKHTRAYHAFHGEKYTIEGVIVGCWKMKDAFGYKVANMQKTSIGLSAIIIEPDGRSWLWEDYLAVIDAKGSGQEF